MMQYKSIGLKQQFDWLVNWGSHIALLLALCSCHKRGLEDRKKLQELKENSLNKKVQKNIILKSTKSGC